MNLQYDPKFTVFQKELVIEDLASTIDNLSSRLSTAREEDKHDIKRSIIKKEKLYFHNKGEYYSPR